MTESWDSLPEELRAFIAAEKACPDPAPEVQARVFAHVASTVGFVPAPVDVPSPPTMPGAPLAPVASSALVRLAGRVSRRGIATFLVGAAVGGAAVETVDQVRGRHESPKPPAVVSVPSAPAIPMLPPVLEPAPSLPPASEPLPPAARRPASVSPSASGAKDKRLEAERKLVEMARTALARGQAGSALAALRRHQHSYPKGELAEERDSLLVSALVATGNYAQAREQAIRFRRHHPRSLFAPVVDQAIESIP
jgi:hypothetical protein